MLRRKRTDVYTIRLYCDEEGCGGEMHYRPQMFAIQDDQTALKNHTCGVCGSTQMVDGEQYPRLQFDEIQEGVAESQPPKEDTKQ